MSNLISPNKTFRLTLYSCFSFYFSCTFWHTSSFITIRQLNSTVKKISLVCHIGVFRWHSFDFSWKSYFIERSTKLLVLDNYSSFVNSKSLSIFFNNFFKKPWIKSSSSPLIGILFPFNQLFRIYIISTYYYGI